MKIPKGKEKNRSLGLGCGSPVVTDQHIQRSAVSIFLSEP